MILLIKTKWNHLQNLINGPASVEYGTYRKCLHVTFQLNENVLRFKYHSDIRLH